MTAAEFPNLIELPIKFRGNEVFIGDGRIGALGLLNDHWVFDCFQPQRMTAAQLRAIADRLEEYGWIEFVDGDEVQP